MNRFPEQFGSDVETTEVDLDVEHVQYRGERLSEARAETVAADVLSRTPGRPSLSGEPEVSPSLTVRLPRQERRRLDEVAASQGRRASEVVRQALAEYLARCER